jgi:hypothetical protein
MRYLFKVLVLLVVVGAGSNSYAQLTPLQFNDKLVAITDSLYVRGQDWGNHFNEAVKNKNFASLRPYRIDLERFVDQKIIAVRAMKDVRNSRSLRLAMLEFLNFEKGRITKAFRPLESLSSKASSEQINAKIEKIREYSKEENVQLEKVNAAQEAYGKDNGFKIEESKPSDGG